MTWRQIYLPGGGGGTGPPAPNPNDAFKIAFKLPETNTAPTDTVTFAMVFPEANAAPVDAYNFVVILPASDAIPAQTDAVLFSIVIPDTVSTASDSVVFGMKFPDSTVAPSDSLKVGFTLPDSTAAPTDSFGIKFLLPETNTAPTETVQFSLTFPESTVVPSDALSVSIRGYSDTNTVPTDAYRVAFTFPETTSAPTDSGTFLFKTRYDESTAAPTDTSKMNLKVAESNVGQTETRALVIRSAMTAFTNGGGTVTTPEKAVGYPDNPPPPAAIDAAYLGYVQQGALQSVGILDTHTPNVPTAGYVAGSASLWFGGYYNNLGTPSLIFVKHDGTLITVLTGQAEMQPFVASGATGLYGPNEATLFRMDNPAGNAAQQSLRSYLNTATIAQINACKVRIQMNDGTGLGAMYQDGAYFKTTHN